MSSVRPSLQRVLSALAIAGAVVTALPIVSLAQGTPGLTIFSGVDRANELGFHLNDGRPNRPDRYYLRIPADKMTLAVDQFTVSYPETYRGRFDPDRVEIRIRGDEIPLNEVIWDQENRVIEIYPETPVPAGTRVELVLSNVRNPNSVGTHYFNALVRSPGDLPLLRYLGTWILTIGDN